MAAEPNQEHAHWSSGLKKLLRKRWFYSVLAFTAVLLYLGCVFLWRWDQTRQLERRAAERKRAEDQRAVEMLGGNRLEILSFYATPGVVRRGEEVQLCYGVANAKTVRLEPQTSAVWPSYGRCVYVTPQTDTTYTLTIEDAEGHTKTATVWVQVR